MPNETAAPVRIGWVVDAQEDFFRPTLPGGRLYIRHLADASDPGAATAIPAMVTVAEWMARECDAVVMQGDWHHATDPEIADPHPDATRGTYPPHCEGQSDDAAKRAGAEVIAEIRAVLGEPAAVLPVRASAEDAARVAAVAAEGRPVFLQKTQFGLFVGNPAADAFLTALVAKLRARRGEPGAPVQITVIGGATDVCVRQFVEPASTHASGASLRVVREAVHGLGLTPDEALFAQWRTPRLGTVSVDDLAREAKR